MASDSQNKRNSPDNVVSLSRHEFVADIEHKLTEARRLFSLHDFVPCEELLLKILELDPRNSKAKALYDLTAIKLSRRKLYKKIVDPRSANKDEMPADSTGSKDNDSLPELNNPSSEIHLQPSLSEDLSQQENPQQKEPSLTQESLMPKSQADSNSPSAESARQMGSMRERTIAALVELFKEKERSLQNWQDPRFRSKQEGMEESGKGSTETSFDRSSQDLNRPPVSLPSQKRDDELSQSNNELDVQPGRIQGMEPPAPRNDRETAQRVPESQFRIPEPEEPVHSQLPRLPEVQPKTSETQPEVIRLPDVRPFDQITAPTKIDYQQLVERKLEEDLANSEVKTLSIAQIKKYLYQEEYELCALQLEKIRKRFPHNSEIQTFVHNASQRLSELQRVKSFEVRARELMLSANYYYQEGKLPEALMAANEVLGVMPEHQQAKEFVSFVQKRMGNERKKGKGGKARHCGSCGTAVDSASLFCFHCGHRLS